MGLPTIAMGVLGVIRLSRKRVHPGAHIMTATKATGPVAVLEPPSKSFRGKKPFSGHQALWYCWPRPGFRAAYFDRFRTRLCNILRSAF
jgi:hypothetical protein